MKIRKENKLLYIDHDLVINLKYYYRYVILFFQEFLYHLIVWYYNKYKFKPRETKYYLSICAIFKNEASFLREWLEYHLIVGVEHFYLYNNFSDDSYKEILQPYIDKGIVDLIEWPVMYGQLPSYYDFWEKYRNETKWVMFIDLDEFMCPVYETDLKKWLRKFDMYPSIRVYWKMFGTSGKIEHDPDTLTIEQYTVCWDKIRTLGKNIVNTEWDFGGMDLHDIYTKTYILGRKIEIPSINVFGKFVKWNIHRLKWGATKESFTLQLNHYWSKAWRIYELKIDKGDAVCEQLLIQRKQEGFFNEHEIRNKEKDYKIFRFLLKVKLSLVEKL